MAKTIDGFQVDFSTDAFPSLPAKVQLRVFPVTTRLPDLQNPGTFTDRDDALLELDLGNSTVLMRIPIEDGLQEDENDDSPAVQLASIFDTLGQALAGSADALETIRTEFETEVNTQYPKLTGNASFNIRTEIVSNWPNLSFAGQSLKDTAVEDIKRASSDFSAATGNGIFDSSFGLSGTSPNQEQIIGTDDFPEGTVVGNNWNKLDSPSVSFNGGFVHFSDKVPESNFTQSFIGKFSTQSSPEAEFYVWLLGFRDGTGTATPVNRTMSVNIRPAGGASDIAVGTYDGTQSTEVASKVTWGFVGGPITLPPGQHQFKVKSDNANASHVDGFVVTTDPNFDPSTDLSDPVDPIYTDPSHLNLNDPSLSYFIPAVPGGSAPGAGLDSLIQTEVNAEVTSQGTITLGASADLLISRLQAALRSATDTFMSNFITSNLENPLDTLTDTATSFDIQALADAIIDFIDNTVYPLPSASTSALFQVIAERLIVKQQITTT